MLQIDGESEYFSFKPTEVEQKNVQSPKMHGVQSPKMWLPQPPKVGIIMSNLADCCCII